jgi:hypothetical protein
VVVRSTKIQGCRHNRDMQASAVGEKDWLLLDAEPTEFCLVDASVKKSDEGVRPGR